MDIRFSPDIQQYVDQQINAGVFGNTSELLAAAVKRMMAEEGVVGWTQETLRAAIAVGMEQAERGEFSTQSIDEIFAEWEQEYSNKH